MRVFSVDDSGWGDALLGVIIAVAPEGTKGKPYWREIEVKYFQEPMFNAKEYLVQAYKIVGEGLEYFNITKDDSILMCRGYILSIAWEGLVKRGFNVQATRKKTRAHEFAERVFRNRLREIGVPIGLVGSQYGSRFFKSLVGWAEVDPTRAKYIKSGWEYFRRRKQQRDAQLKLGEESDAIDF